MASTIYPTGVTIYKPEKCWNGFTIYLAPERGVVIMDMNGQHHKMWKDFQGFPPKMLPNGNVMGSLGERSPKFGHQDQFDVTQLDWDGNVVWSFDKAEYIEDPGEKPRFMARQHHDYQREGNPVGYYVPGMEAKLDSANTLILGHKSIRNEKISDKPLLDDYIFEVDWQGNIIWEWNLNEHFDEIGLSEASKKTLYNNPGIITMTGQPQHAGDWAHINSMSYLGPNKWYDKGDERFHPDNIICDCRDLNFAFIICKKTGKMVWKLGPYYDTPELKHLGWIIGQHHVHMIPRGLPGEGNILIFDNGGWAGYGEPNPGALDGNYYAKRDYSRVLELDPTTFEIVWQYTPKEAGFIVPLNAMQFYSGFVSSAQRLPNGNTMITEGATGRLFEVTKEHEIVWEFINPYIGKMLPMPLVYRGYRFPYEWAPQIKDYSEAPVAPMNRETFRVPGAAPEGIKEVTTVEGTTGFVGLFNPDAKKN